MKVIPFFVNVVFICNMNQQEKIRTLLKEEYEREYILYRAVGLDEAIKSCEAGHLVYYSRDPMSRDWEVIEYGLGSEASEMSEEEVEELQQSWQFKSAYSDFREMPRFIVLTRHKRGLLLE